MELIIYYECIITFPEMFIYDLILKTSVLSSHDLNICVSGFLWYQSLSRSGRKLNKRKLFYTYDLYVIIEAILIYLYLTLSEHVTHLFLGRSTQNISSKNVALAFIVNKAWGLGAALWLPRRRKPLHCVLNLYFCLKCPAKSEQSRLSSAKALVSWGGVSSLNSIEVCGRYTSDISRKKNQILKNAKINIGNIKWRCWLLS